jgi:hypothetical protein
LQSTARTRFARTLRGLRGEISDAHVVRNLLQWFAPAGAKSAMLFIQKEPPNGGSFPCFSALATRNKKEYNTVKENERG